MGWIALLAQTTQNAATDSSTGGGGWFGTVSCFACPCVGIAAIFIAALFLGPMWQRRQIRLDAAAVTRGIYDEQQRERNQTGGGPRPG